MKDYLMALYSRFFSMPKSDETFNELCKNLVESFSVSKKLVLNLKDQEAAFCDTVAFAAFVTGFRLAAGIACELKNEHYSFYDDVEKAAQ